MSILRYLSRFRQARQSLPELADREKWSRGEIEAFQLERLNRLWRHAAAHVPYYRELVPRLSLPICFASLAEFRTTVPVLAKNEVRAAPQRFFSERPAAGGWQRTGGSTGTPMAVYWAKQSHLESLRAKYRMEATWDVDFFDRKVFLWGHSGSLAPGLAGLVARWRRPLEDRLRNRLRLSAYRMGREDLLLYLRKIQAFRPASIYGYSTALYLLAREAAAAGVRLPSLKLAIMTGEPAYPHFVETVEQALGVPAAIEYGSVECGFIAGQWPDGTLRVREDMVLVETESRSDGRFDIVTTVLGNPAFPLIRYETEDMTDAPLQSPDPGFSMLGQISGRRNDLLVSRSGRCVHSLAIKHVFEHSPAVRRLQARQLADGHLIVTVETLRSNASLDVRGAERRVRELLDGYPVTVEVVDRLPSSLSGKHRWIVSEMAPAAVGRVAATSVPSTLD